MKQPLRDWSVDGKAAGRTRTARNFTYATVYGAGHMVLLFSPEARYNADEVIPGPVR